MAMFTLIFADDAEGVARRLEFKAADMTAALLVAHSEALRRTAELWQGSRKLCTIHASPKTVRSLLEYAVSP